MGSRATRLEDFPQLEWSEIAPRLCTGVRDSFETVMTRLDGGVLSREACLQLAFAEGDDLLGLLVAAN